jgi:beta-galactosidase
MINNPCVKKILFGGDYNPEQWDDATRKEDMRMLRLAGIDIVTLNVFSWARLQPSEDVYDFSDLDSIIDMVTDAGMNICLATSTATHPAWMARKYPDVLRVDIDGRKRQFGARQNSCPNSPSYRKYSVRLAEKTAERYGKRKNILAWHISNEYGGLCYCDNCRNAFRQWLKEKYGTIDALNRAWNTSFWGHTYYDWDDIVVPSNLSERWPVNRTSCQIQTIDYYRFQSDSMLSCYRLEADAVRAKAPGIPVTTNLMGIYPELDYHKWAPYMDFISWDNYPSPGDSYTRTAMNHEVMRGCKPGKPFALMEQTPSVTNWQPYNSLKRPGIMRLQSYQAVAHGSDTVMFFQLHRSRGCCEKLHGAVIDHYARTDTRVFRETAALGAELGRLGDAVPGSLIHARAAILFDWNCLWSILFSAGPSVDFNYTREIYSYYDAFAEENIPVDIIDPSGPFDAYDILVAPALSMVSSETAEKITSFTAEGGIFITTCMSGLTDENDLVTTSGYPGTLRKVCGLWVEETDALLPGKSNTFVIADGELKGTYPAVILCDIIHPENAETVAVYGSDFYENTPALCRNKFGKGEAWYAGACIPETDNLLLRKLLLSAARRKGIEPVLPAQTNIEATERIGKDGRGIVFILNHGDNAACVTLPFGGTDLLAEKELPAETTVSIPPKDILILRKK